MANDAKDLITYLLEQLHTELNLIKKDDNDNINEDINDNYQYNENASYRFFYESYIKINNSIISSVFYGISENIIECQRCKQNMNYQKSFNFQTYNFLNFPLQEIKIAKMYNQIPFTPSRQRNQAEINLLDCFNYIVKPTIMSGANQMYCNSCHCQTDCYYTTQFFSFPENLIIILNRGKGNMYNVSVEIEYEINLNGFVNNNNKVGNIYSLYGVLIHLGQSGQQGHFIAICKNPIDGMWYKFNDNLVDKVNDNFLQDINNLGCPYLLFYQKIY